MKRFKFKQPFNGVGNAMNLIPESCKEDGKTFEMTDGNESYKVQWEGNLTEGKANILTASGNDMVNEDFNKMKHLMGYKSKDTLGVLNNIERVNEDIKLKESHKVNSIIEGKEE